MMTSETVTCSQEIHDACECALPVLSQKQIEGVILKAIDECHEEWVAEGIVK